MSKEIQTKFRDTDVTIIAGKYQYINGAPAIEYVETETGEPYLMATVNIWPDEKGLPKDVVAIKNYSENEGVLEHLIKLGIISQPFKYQQSGYVNIPICKLLLD